MLNLILIWYILPMVLIVLISPLNYLSAFTIFFKEDITFKESFKNDRDFKDYCSLNKLLMFPLINILLLIFIIWNILDNMGDKVIDWLFEEVIESLSKNIENKLSNLKFSQIKSFFKIQRK